MENLNKIYVIHVYEYNGDITSNEDYCIRNKIIENDIAYTLEDSIKIGKNSIRNYCYNKIYEDVSDEDLDNIPDNITDDQFESFISNKLKEGNTYAIIISIISGNRKRFNNSKELMEYFNNNIKNISNDNLYDFLLSMVISEDRFYDYNGNYINTFIWDQCPLLESSWDAKIDFNEDDCKKGIYTFEYKV